MQLVEGDRLYLGEKPASLSARSEGEKTGKDRFEVHTNCQKHLLLCHIKKFPESFFISHASIALQSERCDWDKMESSAAF